MQEIRTKGNRQKKREYEQLNSLVSCILRMHLTNYVFKVMIVDRDRHRVADESVIKFIIYCGFLRFRHTHTRALT